MKTATQTAIRGHPLVIMIDAGGAGSAIHAYVTQGIRAVEPPFDTFEEDLSAIKRANDLHGERLLSFFTLNGHNSAPAV